jgi:hypothetical protein
MIEDLPIRGVTAIHLAVTNDVHASGLLVADDGADGVLVGLTADGVKDELPLGVRGKRLTVVPAGVRVVAHHCGWEQYLFGSD